MESRIPTLDLLQNLTSTILDSRRQAHSMRSEIVEVTAILKDSTATWAPNEVDIAEAETRTPQGIAISPSMAAMCADDYVRTVQFLRATHAAIVEVRRRFPDRPARVLYVGCGPLATLAAPLMTIFSPAEVAFTLVDVHSESIESAKSIVETLGLADRVAKFEASEAGTYRVSNVQPPDIILLEIMRACLEAEPQVAVTRHLVRQAPGAILIPEEIQVDFAFVDMAKEHNLDGFQQGDVDSNRRDRIPMAIVFKLNRATVESWMGNTTDRLPGARVRIPETVDERYVPMLLTNIRTYQNRSIGDYDSGLTCPRPLSIGCKIKAGDTIQFHYELGRHPRLRAEVCADDEPIQNVVSQKLFD